MAAESLELLGFNIQNKITPVILKDYWSIARMALEEQVF